MKIELHIIQNFAPSNLNRDDTGAPKDCEFGGYRRARVSSQCLKRAVRRAFRDDGLLPEERLGVRTKRVLNEIVNRLANDGHSPEEAKAVATSGLAAMGLALAKEDKTQYLLFLSPAEIDTMVSLCKKHWSTLLDMAPGDGGKGAKAAKKAGKAAAPKEVSADFGAVLLVGKRAADLALFGRMLADKPDKNIDAAAQVAHAISTHRVQADFDYYTAVDDLKPDDNQGADMIGTVPFNSACMYRYANVDLAELVKNLDGDQELAVQAVRAFIDASVKAIPTGKQTSMAAQNPPSLVMVVVREHSLWSLANAFVKPVQPNREDDLVEASVARLDRYWADLSSMYGDDGLLGAWVATTAGGSLKALGGSRVSNLGDLLGSVDRALQGGVTAGTRR